MDDEPLSSSLTRMESLKIFTLNCWGLRYFSQHRKLRIKLIAQHLSEHDYDIVFLQEVWIQSDFEYIRTKTKSIYTFAHMFNNASILGTSGLVIMAKWIPKIVHFHPYSINGSPFRPNHGDWFSTKGVAYARIELKGFNLHLFCTHMHAQYDEEEDITDQYSIHRICQSYELAKYINLMSCSCSGPSSKDLIILAGDMNTSSKELPYRLLVKLTKLSDCYKQGNMGRETTYRKKEPVSKKPNRKFINKNHLTRLYHCSDDSSDEELITCGHKDNTFTKPSLVLAKSSKRIDFILFKLRDIHTNNDGHDECNNGDVTTRFTLSPSKQLTMLCQPEQMKINAKDVSGLSYSDHQPVAAKLNFVYYPKSTVEEIESKNCDLDNNLPDDDEMGFNLNKSQKKQSVKLKPKYSQQLNRTPSFSNNGNNSVSSLELPDIEILLQNYINESTPLKHLLTVVLALFIVVLIVLTIYLAVDLTAIELTLLTIIMLIVSIFGLLLRFVTHRHEINAIKAILLDIGKKKLFNTDYGLLEETE